MTTSRPTTSKCPQCGYSSSDVSLRLLHGHTTAIESLIRTNERPSDDVERIFQTFVGDGQPKLNRLEARIVSVKALLQELEAAKVELRIAIVAQKKILNPVRRMPAELLVEIFLHGVGYYMDPEEHLLSMTQSVNVNLPPWTYARVCRNWKEIALKTPLLWTRVKVEVHEIVSPNRNHRPTNRPSKSRIPWSLSILSLYLSRSVALPLDVYLDIPTDCLSRSNDPTYAVSNLMASTTRRWKLLFLGRGQGFNNDTMVFSEDSFPLLKTLCVQGADKSTSVDIPALAIQSWSTFTFPNFRNVPTLSTTLYNRITDYSISHIPFNEALRIIQLLPHLRKLTVQNLCPAVSGSARTVRLPTVKELSLDQSAATTDSESLKGFLNTITCPALMSLSLAAHQLLELTVHEFAKRSAFKLVKLDLTRCTRIPERLPNVSYLNTLVIRGVGMAINDVQPLSITEILPRLEPVVSTNTPPFFPFPLLRRLELHICNSLGLRNYDTMEALFISMVARLSHASSSNVSPSEVFITAPDDKARKLLDHPRLGELRSLGMKIDIVAL